MCLSRKCKNYLKCFAICLVLAAVIIVPVLISSFKKENKTPKNLNICHNVYPTSLNIRCSLDGKNVSCYESIKNGTVLKFDCRDTFKIKTPMNYNQIVCEDGHWNLGLIDDCEIKKCPKLNLYKHTSLNVTCYLNENLKINNFIKCTEYLMHGSVVQFSCKENSVNDHLNYTTITCVNGEWNRPLIDCEEKNSTPVMERFRIFADKCPELSSTSLDFKCLYKNKTTSCEKPMVHGTVAILNCKYSYHLDSIPHKELKCVNGKWDKPLFNCTPVCGITKKIIIPRIAHGQTIDMGRFPWHVALQEFDANISDWRYLCGGSILTPKLVITAAHCVQTINKFYRVIVGNVHDNSSNSQNQIIMVIKILIAEKYTGLDNSYSSDLAILVLAKEFILSDIVKPVCIHYDSMVMDGEKYKKGEVPGWGYNDPYKKLFSKQLQYTSFPIIKYEECRSKVPKHFTITLDKFCAGYMNGTNVCSGDSGGGFVSGSGPDNNEEPYYLLGIVSTTPFTENNCGTNLYATYTDVAQHINWINQTKSEFEKWSPFDYGCKLPDQPSFGNYTIDINMNIDDDNFNENNLDAGELVPEYTKLTYTCDKGYEVHDQHLVSCIKRTWNYNPFCAKMCPKLISPELNISYFYKNKHLRNISDDRFLKHETQAVIKCIDNVNFELKSYKTYDKNTCREGAWIYPLPKCKPISGFIPCKSNEKINNESTIYPWNVNIYEKVNNSSLLICTGSILAQFIVLVEYSCVDENKIEKYIVQTGPDIKNVDKEQNSTVYKIIQISNLNVITLLILRHSFKMTPYVRPLHLDQKEFETHYTNLNISIPYRIKEDNRLHLHIMNINYSCLTENCEIEIETNNTVIAFGEIVVMKENKCNVRHCLLGVAKKIKHNKIEIIFLKLHENYLIQEEINKYNIWSDEMAECKLSDIKKPDVEIFEKDIMLKDTVLNTDKVQYNCLLSSYEKYGPEETVCNKSTWSKIPDCLGCGFKPYIPNVMDRSLYNLWPWHVGIYDTINGTRHMICAGTILSTNAILTHGNCFLYYIKAKLNTIMHKCRYVVEAGKIYSEFNHTLDKNNQFACVDELIFDDKKINIVVLILNKPLSLTKFVLPVCLDKKKIINDKKLRELIVPYWINNPMLKNSTAIRTFSIFGKLENKTLTYKSLKDGCALNWRNALGSGLVVKNFENNREQYFSYYILESCSRGNWNFITLQPYISWLTNIIIENKN